METARALRLLTPDLMREASKTNSTGSSNNRTEDGQHRSVVNDRLLETQGN